MIAAEVASVSDSLSSFSRRIIFMMLRGSLMDCVAIADDEGGVAVSHHDIIVTAYSVSWNIQFKNHYGSFKIDSFFFFGGAGIFWTWFQ